MKSRSKRQFKVAKRPSYLSKRKIVRRRYASSSAYYGDTLLWIGGRLYRKISCDSYSEVRGAPEIPKPGCEAVGLRANLPRMSKYEREESRLYSNSGYKLGGGSMW